jgi:hypothetical protein
MSKSRKKPIVKDKTDGAKYHRTIRRVTNEKVRYLKDDLDDEGLRNPKEIVNDYNFSDWEFDLRFRDDEMSKKASRK